MQIYSKSPKDPPVEALDLGELIQEPHYADDLVGGTFAPLHFEPIFPLRPCRKLSIFPLAQSGTLVLLFVKRSFCKDSPSLQLPIPISWNQWWLSVLPGESDLPFRCQLQVKCAYEDYIDFDSHRLVS
jgi:hypothetical protein